MGGWLATGSFVQSEAAPAADFTLLLVWSTNVRSRRVGAAAKCT